MAERVHSDGFERPRGGGTGAMIGQELGEEQYTRGDIFIGPGVVGGFVGCRGGQNRTLAGILSTSDPGRRSRTTTRVRSAASSSAPERVLSNPHERWDGVHCRRLGSLL